MDSPQQTCPLPLHPFPLENGGMGATPMSQNETAVGLHSDFAGRLTQSYILKLLDRVATRASYRDPSSDGWRYTKAEILRSPCRSTSARHVFRADGACRARTRLAKVPGLRSRPELGAQLRSVSYTDSSEWKSGNWVLLLVNLVRPEAVTTLRWPQSNFPAEGLEG